MFNTRVLVPAALAAVFLTGCARSPEEKAAKFLERGNAQYQKKDYARAILEYRNAAQALPKAAEPHYRLGLAYLATGDHKLAAQHIMQATELDPKHINAQLKLAEMMATSRTKETLEEAQKRAEQVLAASPGNVQALDALALTDIRLGNKEAAEKHLKEALERFPSHLRSSVALAQVKLANQDQAGSEKVLKDAVAQAPQAADPAVALGEFYLMLGKTAEGEQLFRRALQNDPQHALALLDLARLRARLGSKDEAEQLYKRLSALPSTRFKPAHALYLLQIGKTAEALAELEKLAREDSNDREARTRLVAAYQYLNRPADAERVLTEALKKNKKDTDALMQRSRMYLASGKITEAQTDLTQVLNYRPDSGQAHYLMSKVHQARGAAENRKQELAEALRREPANLQARLEMADLLLASKAAKSALELLNEAPGRQKAAIALVVKRNWVLLALGRKEDFRAGVAAVLASRRIPEALVQDAVWRLGQRDFNAARASAEEALKQDPENARALELVLSTYLAQKRLSAGIERVRQYAAQRPSSIAIQQFLGELLVASGNRAEARAQFQKVKALGKFTTADIFLANIDMAEGKLDVARKSLSAMVSANPRNLEAHLALGTLEEHAANYRAAMDHYRKALDIDPHNVAALNNLAYLLGENAGQPAEALKYAQQAKEIAPDNPVIDDTLGWLYYRNGIYMSAVRHLESAVSRQGTARRKYHLAMAYAKAGNRDRGQKTLDEALKMDARLPEAQTARQILAETR